jgi:uncharacterized protein YceH (UPF0502 family)
MHFSALTPVQQRVLGCLIEKRWTTPDQYPLSLNALRLAANQSTNREPITHYGEAEIREAAQRLSLYGLARLASGAGSRATKYRHLAEEGLGLDRVELAVLAVLLLRGPQTVGEIKQRSERMAPMASLADAQRTLDQLVARNYAERLERRPGQKEERYRHRLGEVDEDAGQPAPPHSVPAAGHASLPAAASPVPTATVTAGAPGAPPGTVSAPPVDPGDNGGDRDGGGSAALEARVAALEDEVARLRRTLDELLG